MLVENALPCTVVHVLYLAQQQGTGVVAQVACLSSAVDPEHRKFLHPEESRGNADGLVEKRIEISIELCVAFFLSVDRVADGQHLKRISRHRRKVVTAK